MNASEIAEVGGAIDEIVLRHGAQGASAMRSCTTDEAKQEPSSTIEVTLCVDQQEQPSQLQVAGGSVDVHGRGVWAAAHGSAADTVDTADDPQQGPLNKGQSSVLQMALHLQQERQQLENDQAAQLMVHEEAAQLQQLILHAQQHLFQQQQQQQQQLHNSKNQQHGTADGKLNRARPRKQARDSGGSDNSRRKDSWERDGIPCFVQTSALIANSCGYCGSRSTSGCWRRGWELGAGRFINLCNKCGLRHKAGKLKNAPKPLPCQPRGHQATAALSAEPAPTATAHASSYPSSPHMYVPTRSSSSSRPHHLAALAALAAPSSASSLMMAQAGQQQAAAEAEAAEAEAAEAAGLRVPKMPLEHSATLLSMLEQTTSSWLPNQGNSMREVWSGAAAATAATAAAVSDADLAGGKNQQLQLQASLQQQQQLSSPDSIHLTAGAAAEQLRGLQATEGKYGASDSMFSDHDLLGLEAVLASAAAGYERMNGVCHTTSSALQQLLLAASPPVWPDVPWQPTHTTTTTTLGAARDTLPAVASAGNSGKRPRQQNTGPDAAAVTPPADLASSTAMVDATGKALGPGSSTVQAAASKWLSSELPALASKSAGSAAKRRKATKGSWAGTAGGAAGAGDLAAPLDDGFVNPSTGTGRAAAGPGLASEESLATGIAADALLALNNSSGEASRTCPAYGTTSGPDKGLQASHTDLWQAPAAPAEAAAAAAAQPQARSLTPVAATAQMLPSSSNLVTAPAAAGTIALAGAGGGSTSPLCTYSNVLHRSTSDSAAAAARSTEWWWRTGPGAPSMLDSTAAGVSVAAGGAAAGGAAAGAGGGGPGVVVSQAAVRHPLPSGARQVTSGGFAYQPSPAMNRFPSTAVAPAQMMPSSSAVVINHPPHCSAMAVASAADTQQMLNYSHKQAAAAAADLLPMPRFNSQQQTPASAGSIRQHQLLPYDSPQLTGGCSSAASTAAALMIAAAVSPVRRWSCERLGSWLLSVGCGDAAAAFGQQGMDGLALAGLVRVANGEAGRLYQMLSSDLGVRGDAGLRLRLVEHIVQVFDVA